MVSNIHIKFKNKNINYNYLNLFNLDNSLVFDLFNNII